MRVISILGVYSPINFQKCQDKDDPDSESRCVDRKLKIAFLNKIRYFPPIYHIARQCLYALSVKVFDLVVASW